MASAQPRRLKTCCNDLMPARYEEAGVVEFQHPLTFWVQSNSDDYKWYIVDLSQIGIDPECPKGQCDCRAGEIATSRIERGIPFKMCAHLRRARAFVTCRINRGDYDEYLKTI